MDTVPPGQGKHPLDAFTPHASEYVPAAQGRQVSGVAAPETEEKVPGPHSVQLVVLLALV